MEEKNAAIVERLSRIDALMKRYQGRRFRGGRRGGRRGMPNPHRGQGRVLTLLRLQPEITQKDLGYLLDMRTQSLGELLSKLERAGYITKEPSEADRRSMVVKLTPEGAKAAENLADSDDEWSVVFGGFTEEESDQLIALLDKLIASLERAAEAEGESDRRGRPAPPPPPMHPDFNGWPEGFEDHRERMVEYAERMGMDPRTLHDARDRGGWGGFEGFGGFPGFDPHAAGFDPHGFDPRTAPDFDEDDDPAPKREDADR
ncbi:MarR family winged helix-turn-helix transcriptional regulator [Eggerthella sinensis]|uniref:MarR family winged helix-turn-helix transcriptional regulator n=1 Tax=Eggerthella sinensis TaxID=242230 RepID=UPI00266DBEBA|nr:MarR family transcriptional regulator [Eggerthella sinensis]